MKAKQNLTGGLLSKYTEPEEIQNLLDQAEAGIAFKESRFQFVIVQIDEMPSPEMHALATSVIQTFSDHGAMLGEICSCFIVGYFGLPNAGGDGDLPEKRRRLVRTLIDQNGKNIRIIHGQSDGFSGVVGAKMSWRFSAFIPHFAKILTDSFTVPFGNTKELPLVVP